MYFILVMLIKKTLMSSKYYIIYLISSSIACRVYHFLREFSNRLLDLLPSEKKIVYLFNSINLDFFQFERFKLSETIFILSCNLWNTLPWNMDYCKTPLGCIWWVWLGCCRKFIRLFQPSSYWFGRNREEDGCDIGIILNSILSELDVYIYIYILIVVWPSILTILT